MNIRQGPRQEFKASYKENKDTLDRDQEKSVFYKDPNAKPSSAHRTLNQRPMSSGNPSNLRKLQTNVLKPQRNNMMVEQQNDYCMNGDYVRIGSEKNIAPLGRPPKSMRQSNNDSGVDNQSAVLPKGLNVFKKQKTMMNVKRLSKCSLDENMQEEDTQSYQHLKPLIRPSSAQFSGQHSHRATAIKETQESDFKINKRSSVTKNEK